MTNQFSFNFPCGSLKALLVKLKFNKPQIPRSKYQRGWSW